MITNIDNTVQIIPTPAPILELKILCESLDLKNLYLLHVEAHNNKINTLFTDAGFDLINPCDLDIIEPTMSLKYDLGVKMCLSHCMYETSNTLRIQPHGCMLLPRSSTGANTNIRMSNSVGIIDSGYRGSLCALIDVPIIQPYRCKLEKNKRNFQVVSFSGYAIHVIIVDTLEDLGTTIRGEGGIGSTGR
jgi:dUTP pyrophosphatase